MIYRCYKREREECDCQFGPCEFTSAEMNAMFTRSTPCPMGEADYFLESNEESEFFLLVVGTRTYENYDFFSQKMDVALSKKDPDDIIIVSGGATGVDSMAERYAREKHYRFLCFPAKWKKGNVAGYERNRAMHEYIAKYPNRGVLAFWDGESKGTSHSFKLAQEFSNPIKCVRI